MRFILIDRILECVPGGYIVTKKNLTLAEEYLADHFPGFPVMPGVLMLEAMTQSAAWLIRLTDDYADSIISLKEARNVKYNHFVQPGQTLTLRIEVLSREPGEVKVKAQGWVDDEPALSARLVLSHHSIGRDYPALAWKDQSVINEQKKIYELIAPQN